MFERGIQCPKRLVRGSLGLGLGLRLVGVSVVDAVGHVDVVVAEVGGNSLTVEDRRSRGGAGVGVVIVGVVIVGVVVIAWDGSWSRRGCGRGCGRKRGHIVIVGVGVVLVVVEDGRSRGGVAEVGVVLPPDAPGSPRGDWEVGWRRAGRSRRLGHWGLGGFGAHEQRGHLVHHLGAAEVVVLEDRLGHGDHGRHVDVVHLGGCGDDVDDGREREEGAEHVDVGVVEHLAPEGGLPAVVGDLVEGAVLVKRGEGADHLGVEVDTRGGTDHAEAHEEQGEPVLEVGDGVVVLDRVDDAGPKPDEHVGESRRVGERAHELDREGRRVRDVRAGEDAADVRDDAPEGLDVEVVESDEKLERVNRLVAEALNDELNEPVAQRAAGGGVEVGREADARVVHLDELVELVHLPDVGAVAGGAELLVDRDDEAGELVGAVLDELVDELDEVLERLVASGEHRAEPHLGLVEHSAADGVVELGSPCEHARSVEARAEQHVEGRVVRRLRHVDAGRHEELVHGLGEVGEVHHRVAVPPPEGSDHVVDVDRCAALVHRPGEPDEQVVRVAGGEHLGQRERPDLELAKGRLVDDAGGVEVLDHEPDEVAKLGGVHGRDVVVEHLGDLVTDEPVTGRQRGRRGWGWVVPVVVPVVGRLRGVPRLGGYRDAVHRERQNRPVREESDDADIAQLTAVAVGQRRGRGVAGRDVELNIGLVAVGCDVAQRDDRTAGVVLHRVQVPAVAGHGEADVQALVDVGVDRELRQRQLVREDRETVSPHADLVQDEVAGGAVGQHEALVASTDEARAVRPLGADLEADDPAACAVLGHRSGSDRKTHNAEGQAVRRKIAAEAGWHVVGVLWGVRKVSCVACVGSGGSRGEAVWSCEKANA